MKRIGDINALELGRKILTNSERAKQQKEQQEEEKVAGYQQLVELCLLGEEDAAQTLAHQHPNWGYKIVDGQVMIEER